MVDSFDQLGKEDGGVAREDRSVETFTFSTSMAVQREPDERGSSVCVCGGNRVLGQEEGRGDGCRVLVVRLPWTQE